MRFSKNTPQAAFLLGAGACAASTAFAQETNTSSSESKWTLSTTDFVRDAWQVQPYVANGYIGQRIPAGELLLLFFSCRILRLPPLPTGLLTFPLSFGCSEGFGYREFTPVNQSAHDETQGTFFSSPFRPSFLPSFLPTYHLPSLRMASLHPASSCRRPRRLLRPAA